MTTTVMKYPGGKSKYATRIINQFPDHRVYVEPFAGSGTVLYHKQPSEIEVYNDRNEDLVHFFNVLRERPDELIDWLDLVPYSRAVHRDWCREFEAGDRPDDDIERAGKFFALRYLQFGAAIDRVSGFNSCGGRRDVAGAFDSARQRLHDVAERYNSVVVECLDWRDCVERYDGDDVLFYCDPPYLDKEDYYGIEFDHDEFGSVLSDVDGKWIVSYAHEADTLNYTHCEEYAGSHGELENGTQKEVTERLYMNFEPGDVPQFSEAGQATLTFD